MTCGVTRPGLAAIARRRLNNGLGRIAAGYAACRGSASAGNGLSPPEEARNRRNQCRDRDPKSCTTIAGERTLSNAGRIGRCRGAWIACCICALQLLSWLFVIAASYAADHVLAAERRHAEQCQRRDRAHGVEPRPRACSSREACRCAVQPKASGGTSDEYECGSGVHRSSERVCKCGLTFERGSARLAGASPLDGMVRRLVHSFHRRSISEILGLATDPAFGETNSSRRVHRHAAIHSSLGRCQNQEMLTFWPSTFVSGSAGSMPPHGALTRAVTTRLPVFMEVDSTLLG